jgi:hypothetical protein
VVVRRDAVVLVEGPSDRVALETLALRRGRDLAAEGVRVLPVGGAQAMGRLVERYGPHGANVRVAGLCDAGEVDFLRRALRRAGVGLDLGREQMERLGFYVCDPDLEHEVVRALGPDAVEEVLAAHGKLGSFRTNQKQPAHRARSLDEQLCGFLTNWKIALARPLVEALDLSRVPRPLDGALTHV